MQLKIVSFFCFLLAFASHVGAQQTPRVPKVKKKFNNVEAFQRTNRAEAPKLHTFIIADDTDASIGSMVDYTNMQTCVKSIAEQSGLTPATLELFKKSGKNANALKTKLENLTCGSNDAVFFYYTGHGFNAQGSEFTSFQFDDIQFSMDYVTAQLGEHHPRLLVVMYDACNYMPASRRALPTRSNIAPRSEKLKTLFRNTAGVVKIASNTAGPDKFSIGLTDKGGLFTNVFYLALEKAPANSWKSVLEYAKTTTAEIAEAKWGKEQVPFFKDDTRAVTNAVDPNDPIETEQQVTNTPAQIGGKIPPVKPSEPAKKTKPVSNHAASR